MTMNDPIADMLTRLRNWQGARKKEVIIPASRLKKAVLNVLTEEGYLRGVEEGTDDKGHPTLVAQMKYYQGKPVMSEIKRVSTPGLRQYSPSQEIPMVRTGLGITIVSTSKGVMTDTSARAQNVGGEVLCQVF